MFTFQVPVAIFASYPFRFDHNNVISDSPVEEDQTIQMMISEGVSFNGKTISDTSLGRNSH
jgi:hypothetical protein